MRYFLGNKKQRRNVGSQDYREVSNKIDPKCIFLRSNKQLVPHVQKARINLERK